MRHDPLACTMKQVKLGPAELQRASSTTLHSTAHLLCLLQPTLLGLLLGSLGFLLESLLRDAALLPPGARLLPSVDDLLLLLRLSNCTQGDLFRSDPTPNEQR